MRAPISLLALWLVVLGSLTLLAQTLIVSSASSPSPVVRQSRLQSGTTLNNILQAGIIELKPGENVKRAINGGDEVQGFELMLLPGQYAKLLIKWQGLDLETSVIKPDGTRAFDFDMQVVGPGPTSLSILADQPGRYKLQVRPSETVSVNGSYEVKLEGVRAPTPADNNSLAAEKALAEAQHQKLKEAAIIKYEQAAQLWREAEDAPGEANALRGLAGLYRKEGDLKKAEENYDLALALWRKVGDRSSEAYVLIDLGVASQSIASPDQAIDFYQRARQIFKEINDQMGDALASYSIGLAYARLGKMPEALKYDEEALKIYQSEKDRLGEARTLNNMGGAYEVLGDYDKALELHQRAAPLFRVLNDLFREGISINNIAVIYYNRGDWQKARENYDQALAIYKSLLKQDWMICGSGASARIINICSAAASSLDSIGELYNSLNNPQAATEVFKESLSIRQSLKQPRGLGSTLSRICYAAFLQGRYKDALDSCNQALPYNQAAKDYRESSTNTVLGMIYSALDEPQKALDYYRKALLLQEKVGDRRAQAITLDKMGIAYASAGNTKDALESYNRALQHWRGVKDRDGEAITLYNLARQERERGNLEEAHSLIEQAVAIVESLRVNVNNQRLRTSYFATKVNFYELDVDLKMQLAKTGARDELWAAALQVNERARARSLLDTLAETQVDVRQTGDPELRKLLERRLAVGHKLSARETSLTKLLSGKYEKAAADTIAREIERLTLDYDEIEARIKRQSPRYATLIKPQVLNLKEIQQKLLDDRTLLLEYTLGDQRSYLWIVSQTGIKAYELPKRSEIEEAARRFKKILVKGQGLAGQTTQHYQMRSPETQEQQQYRREALSLGRMLLGQAAAELGDKRLLIVAEGELQSISFAALPEVVLPETDRAQAQTETASTSETTPLLARHEIVYLPSATTLSLIRSFDRLPRSSKSVAVLADPVFESDDPRLFRAGRHAAPGQTSEANSRLAKQVLRDYGLGLPRLFAARQEAKDIMALVPPGTGMEALDFKANHATATNPSLGQYRVVHFATHSLFNDEYPELSGIVLSLYDERGRPQENGFLRLQDIYNLKLPVELVVLSACRTGLGKNVRGEGLIGLTRGFMYAGAARVVATLWKVDDEATAELMKRFYQHLFKDGMSAAASLQAAQMSVREQKRWSAPYFWAGFVLQGEWK